jgi:hypothetical protein
MTACMHMGAAVLASAGAVSTSGAGLVAGGSGETSGSAAEFRLTEIRVDQQGSDTDEYFEIHGAPGASLAGVWFVAIGDSGTDPHGVVEMAVNLSAWSLGSNGCLVARESSFGSTAFNDRSLSVHPMATDAVIGTGDSLNFENSDTVTYLLVRSFTGSAGLDLDTDNDGTLDLTPWAELLDGVAFVRSGKSELAYATDRVGPIALTATGGMPPHAWRDASGWQVGGYATWESDSPGTVSAVPAPAAALLVAGAGVGFARPGRRRA